MGAQEKLPLIGHDLALVQGLVKQLNTRLSNVEATDVHRDADGRTFRFDVHILDPDGKPTGRIARVSTTLDRIDEEMQRG